MPSFEGLPARRAALQMLDAVLRRGQTLDAAGVASRKLSPPDQALALAIAGETLRRLPGRRRSRIPPATATGRRRALR